MQEAFRTHLESEFPELFGESFIIACSGGLDSVVLTHLCSALGLDFILAHANFQLRGAASDADGVFVADLAHTMNKKHIIKAFDTKGYVSLNKVSIQEGARQLRYHWFEELVGDGAGNYVLTAHHADDQLETFLINLSRGSGLEGLCGIPPRNKHVRRPLLPFSRTQLEGYARSKGIDWREDATNTGLDYLRNRIRHLAVPGLKEAIPDLLERFGDTLGHLQGNRELIRNHMTDIRARVVSQGPDGVHFQLDELQRLSPQAPYLHALLYPYGFRDWAAVERLLGGSSGKEVLSPTHRLLRGRGALILRPISNPSHGPYPVGPDLQPEGLPLKLDFQSVQTMEAVSPTILYVDREALKQGLTLRKWQEGDYFYPLGMTGGKKVSKFFKDLRLSQYQKEDTWLLCSGEDIVWVVGLRADDRFKVTPETQQILKITWVQEAS